MSDDLIELDRVSAEEMAAAFARPMAQLPVPVAQGGALSISDGVITAQKVEVKRDLSKVVQDIKVSAAVGGENWYYGWNVTKKDGTKERVEGPSIKCALNVVRIFGNCQVDTRVMDNGAHWIIYARFVDYETGFSLTRPFQQRKNQQTIKGDADRALDIAFQIGVSKAIRNVVCNALEMWTDLGFEEAKKSLVEKIGRNLEAYKQRVSKRLVELDVTVKRVEIILGRPFNDWTAPDVAKVIAQIKAINDGMATIDETWPPEAPAEPNRSDFKDGGAVDSAATKTDATSTPAAAGNGVVADASKQDAVQAGKDTPTTETKVETGKTPAAETKATVVEQPGSFDLFDHSGTQVGTFDAETWLVEFGKCVKVAGRRDADRLDKANLAGAKAVAAHPATSQKIKDDLGRRFGPALW